MDKNVHYLYTIFCCSSLVRNDVNAVVGAPVCNRNDWVQQIKVSYGTDAVMEFILI